jgi:hypothetical protein
MERRINGHVILVDDEDADLLRSIELKHTPYGSYARTIRRPRKMLHRLVLERKLGRPLKRSEKVDHINWNGLDNRRGNLRLATTAENARNRGPTKANKSGYKGVCWYKPSQKWMAYIWHGKHIALGLFDDPAEAARAHDEAARQYHGEFAYLNFPD